MNMKILLLSLLAFSFLLAGCGGKKNAETTAPLEVDMEESSQTASPSEPNTQEEVEVQSPSPTEQSTEEVPRGEVSTTQESPTEPGSQETTSSDGEELAQLFDIEINEPPNDFEYESALGE